MSKCLNCGKEVKNKFCNTSCQNQYRSKMMQEEYNRNPNLCACCNTPLTGEQRRNKYCSSSCAASINNIGVNRYNSSTDKIIEKFKDTIKAYQCSDEQFKEYIQNFTSGTQLYKDLGYSQGRFEKKQYIIKRCQNLGLQIPPEEPSLSSKTKREAFEEYKNGQSARSGIRKLAQKTFIKSGLNCKCLLCGYDKYIEIAHIKAVSDFDDKAFISEINALDNLIPLCPNHHGEFDHGCLSKEDIDKINNYHVK